MKVILTNVCIDFLVFMFFFINLLCRISYIHVLFFIFLVSYRVCVVVLYYIIFLLLSLTLRDATSICCKFMLRSNKVLDDDNFECDRK